MEPAPKQVKLIPGNKSDVSARGHSHGFCAILHLSYSECFCVQNDALMENHRKDHEPGIVVLKCWLLVLI